jgi:hypothetical protein
MATCRWRVQGINWVSCYSEIVAGDGFLFLQPKTMMGNLTYEGTNSVKFFFSVKSEV